MAKKTQPGADLGRLSTPAGFNIPKIKKIKSTAVLNHLLPSDRQSLELVRDVDRTCLDPDLKIRKQWKVSAAYTVSPSTQVETRYREKRAEMKEQGGGRLQQEVLGFYNCRSKVLATDIAKTGIKTNPFVKGCLGDPAQGVYLFRYLDAALLSQKDLKTACIMVFKVLQGRSKQVPVSELHSSRTVTREPTPNFDCHVSQSAPRNGESHTTLCSKSQMYLYEYTDDALPAEYPRQCLPFAVLEFINNGIERKDSDARVGGPKNFYASAANAGWTSNPRTVGEIRKSGSEPFGPVSKETSFTSKPIEPLIPPPTPLLTPNTAEGKDSFPSVSSQNVDRSFEAQRVALELKGQSADVGLSKTPDMPTNQPAHGKGLHFTGPGDWNLINDSGIESATHPVSFAGPRDPRLQRLSASDSFNKISSAQPFLLNRTAGNVINGHQSIGAQNPLTFGRTNSVPEGILHDSNISVNDPRLLLQERSSDGKTFIRQLSESACGFQTDSENSSHPDSTNSAPRVPVLNLVPAKSALKKPTAPLPSTPQADVKKKKTLSFQDYLKKKKAEAHTSLAVKDTVDSASLSVAGDKTETGQLFLTSSKEEHLLSTKIPAIPRMQEFQGCDYNPPDLSHSHTDSDLKNKSAVSHSAVTTKPNDEVHRHVQAVASDNTTLFSGQVTSGNKNKIFSKDPRHLSSDSSASLKPDVRKACEDVNMGRGLEGPPAKIEQEKEKKSSRKCFQELISESEVVKKTPENKSVVLQERVEADKKCVAKDLSSDFIDDNHQVLFADIEDTETENALSVFLDESPLAEESECGLEIALETNPTAGNDVPADTCLNKPDKEKCETKITGDKTENKLDVQDNCLGEQSESWKGVNKYTKEIENETFEQRCSDSPKLESAKTWPEHENNSHQKQLASHCESALGQSSNQHDSDDNEDLPCSNKRTRGKNSSFYKTRNLSPSSASSVQTSSCIDSSKESTPDLSASVSPETRSSDVEANGSGQEDGKRNGSKTGKRQTAKSKQSGKAADIDVPEVDYALLRLAKGLRPGRGIQVEGLGKNPTDDPLPILEGRRRKKSNQEVKKKCEEKKAIVQEEKSLQQSETTDKIPKRKRKAALSKGKKKGKRPKTVQEPASPQMDDDIDYTDFQFEDPQEFCVSIGDDLEAINNRSASLTAICPAVDVPANGSQALDSVVVKVEPEDNDLYGWTQLLPLSSLGLHHWKEALVQPSLDPRVELVDLFKVSPGVVDFDNCTICQKVIDQTLIEDDHTDSEPNLSSTNQRGKDVSSPSSATTIPKEKRKSVLAVDCMNREARSSAADQDHQSPSLDGAASAEGRAVLSEKTSSVAKHDDVHTHHLDQPKDNLVSASTTGVLAADSPSCTKHTDDATRTQTIADRNDNSLFVSSLPNASVASSVKGGVLFEKLSSVVAQTDDGTKTQSVDKQNDNSSGLLPLSDNVTRGYNKEVSEHLPSITERTKERKEECDDSKLSDKKVLRFSAESTMTSISQAATNEKDSSKENDQKLVDVTFESKDRIVKDTTKNNFEPLQRSLSCVENSPPEILSKSTTPNKGHKNEMNHPIEEKMKHVEKPLQSAASLKTAVSSDAQTDVHKSTDNVLSSVPTSGGACTTVVDDSKSSKNLLFPSTGNTCSPSQKIYLQQNAKTNVNGKSSPRIQPSPKSTRPRPSLGVCSQGSTKQRWQLWKSNQALQMKANTTCNIRENEKQNSSTYDEDEKESDSGPNQLIDTVVKKSTFSRTRDDCVEGDDRKLLCSQDHTSEQNSPVVYEKQAAQSDSYCVSPVASVSSQSNQSTSWLETGYWLGINELASLHQPEKGNTTHEDGTDMFSRSVPKISPSKLSQLVPEKITSPSVPVFYPKPKPDQSYQNYIDSSVDDFHHHTTSEQTVSMSYLHNSEALQPSSIKIHDSDLSSAGIDGKVQSTEMFNSSSVGLSGDFQQTGIVRSDNLNLSALRTQTPHETPHSLFGNSSKGANPAAPSHQTCASTDDLVSSDASERISENSDHFGLPQVKLPTLPRKTSTEHTLTPEGTGRQSCDHLGADSSIVSQQDNPTACLGEKADVSLKDDSQFFDGIIKKKVPHFTQSSIPGLDLVRKLKNKESNFLNKSVLSIMGDADLTTTLKGILKTVGVESNDGNQSKNTTDCLVNPKGDGVHMRDQDISTEKQNQFDTVAKTVSEKLCGNSAETEKEGSQNSMQSNSLSANKSKRWNEELDVVGSASKSKNEAKSLSVACEPLEKINQKSTSERCAINSDDEKISSSGFKWSKKTADKKLSNENRSEYDDEVGGLEDGFNVSGCPIPTFTRERNIAKKMGNDKKELDTLATSEKEGCESGFNRNSVPLKVIRHPFPASYDQPPPPGTDPLKSTALNNRGQLGYNLPSQNFTGLPLYHQPVAESPMFVPTMPMPVPCALVPHAPYGQSIAQPHFTTPPPPLASTVAGINLTIPPPVTVSYPEVVTAKQTQTRSESIGDSAAFHAAIPCETSISKQAVQPNENADVNADKSQSKEKIDVITWFTNREAAARNPPKKDLMDWFSDIIDGKRNTTPSVDLEPELKKAKLDFMESLHHKKSLSCRKRSLSSDSDESTSDKKQVPEVDTNKVSFKIGNSSDGINKRKGPLRKSVNFESDSDSDESAISKETSTDSCGATSSSLMNKPSKESADGYGITGAKSSDGNIDSTEKGLDSSRDSKDDGKPDKNTGHSNKKRLQSRWDQRESSSKKSKVEGNHSLVQSKTEKQVSLPVSKTPKPKNNHNKTDGIDRQDSKANAPHIEHNDTDDDMNDYALALLEGDLTVKRLETISNKISDSILKSVSSASKPPKSDDRLLFQHKSSAESPTSCDRKQSKPEKSKSSLTDKPLEFLLFAKEMIMQKLQEVEGGSVDKSTTDMQADDADQSLSEACQLQDASQKLRVDQKVAGETKEYMKNTDHKPKVSAQSSRESHTVQSKNMSAVGQRKAKLKDRNCKSSSLTPPSEISGACASVEVHKNSVTQANLLSSSLAAADMSAVTEEEINKLKNIVCQLSSLPPADDGEKHTDTVEQYGNETKSKASIEVSGNDHIVESSGVKEKRIQDRPKKTGSAGRDWSLFLTKPRSSQRRDLSSGFLKRNYYGDIIESPLSLDRLKPVERPPAHVPTVTSLSHLGVKSTSYATYTPALVSEAFSKSKMGLTENARCSGRPKQSAESAHADRSVARYNENCTVLKSISDMDKTRTTVEPSETHDAKSKSHGNVTVTSKFISQEATGAKPGNSRELKSSMTAGSSQQKVTEVASIHQPSSSRGSLMSENEETNSGNVLQKEQDRTTLKDLLLEKFPGEDPKSLAQILDYELTADVSTMSNKTKKNILFRVRKHLDSKTAAGTSGKETPSCSVAPPIRELLLEEFAADQIELELRLVEGCMRLLEATQQIQSTFDEIQTNSNDQSLKKLLPKNSQLTVRDAFTMVVQDFNNAIKDARREWRGRPHQRIPSELLLSEEQGKLYTKDGTFVVLLSTIPTKPFAKLLQSKKDTEACLTKIGQAACGNKTFVLQQEKQRLELLRTQRSQTLRTFTGTVSQSRLKKVTMVRDNYATSRYQLLRVLGHESVAKMVYFRASYEAIQNHVQIIEGEMHC